MHPHQVFKICFYKIVLWPPSATTPWTLTLRWCLIIKYLFCRVEQSSTSACVILNPHSGIQNVEIVARVASVTSVASVHGFLSTISKSFVYCFNHVIPLVNQLSGGQAINVVIRCQLFVPILCNKYEVHVASK